jgi:hypothetical protein
MLHVKFEKLGTKKNDFDTLLHVNTCKDVSKSLYSSLSLYAIF